MPIYTIQDIAYKIINFKERPTNLMYPIRLHNLLYMILLDYYKNTRKFLFYSDIVKKDTGVVFSALDDKNNLSLNAIGQIIKINNYVPMYFNLPDEQQKTIEEHFLDIIKADESLIENTIKKYNTIDDYHLVEMIKNNYIWKISSNTISSETIEHNIDVTSYENDPDLQDFIKALK